MSEYEVRTFYEGRLVIPDLQKHYKLNRSYADMQLEYDLTNTGGVVKAKELTVQKLVVKQNKQENSADREFFLFYLLPIITLLAIVVLLAKN